LIAFAKVGAVVVITMLTLESDVIPGVMDASLLTAGVRSVTASSHIVVDDKLPERVFKNPIWHANQQDQTNFKEIVGVPVFQFDKWIVLCPVGVVRSGRIQSGKEAACIPFEKTQIRHL
jgi:hypothetical protein